MKLYKPQPPPKLLRVNIKKQGYNTEHITIVETTQTELISYLRALIEKQGISVLETGRRTTVEVREAQGRSNGKSDSFSFKGMDPIKVKELILLNIK